MDVLLYQSAYCEHISNIVKKECNRILQLYRKRNPSFKGSVSLCGHSLGSAILFDILCHQTPGTTEYEQSVTAHTEDVSCQRDKEQSDLSFECEELFCLGSPIALFQMLKGKTISGHSFSNEERPLGALEVDLSSNALGSLQRPRPDAHNCTARDVTDNPTLISAPKCGDLYNIFHPSDPVSYRIEPLVSLAMASLKPQPLPSVKKSLWTTSGESLSILRDRMGQSVGSLWSNFTSGVASSLLNRSLGLNANGPPTVSDRSSEPVGLKHTRLRLSQDESLNSEDHFQTLIDPEIETLYSGFQKGRVMRKESQACPGDIETDLGSDDQERRMRFEDAKIRALNSNGRIDYSIQE